MAVEFMNFWNPQTYHFFLWISHNGNPGELIRQAYELVEGDPWFEMDLDSSTIARDKLAERLEAVLEELQGHIDIDTGEFDAIGDVNSHIDSLFLPIIKLALAEIDFRIVAEALMKQAGKWAPDRELPEVQ